MCEIHYIKNPQGITIKERKIITTMLKKGSKINEDGSGYFSPSQHSKNLKIVNTSRIKGEEWTVLHNRLSTSGAINHLNTQPIKKERYIIAHNGVLWDKNTEGRSDTFNLLRRFEELSKYETIKNIKSVMKEVQGSYSIFLYDRIEKRLFYFKNDNTSFSFYSFGKTIIGSTKEERIISATTKKNNGMKTFYKTLTGFLKPKSYKIYELNNEKPFLIVGSIKKKKILSNYNNILFDYGYGDWKKYNEEKKEKYNIIKKTRWC